MLQDGRVPRSTFWTPESAISEYAQELFFWTSNTRDDLASIPMEVFVLESIADNCADEEQQQFVRSRLRDAAAHLNWWMKVRSRPTSGDLHNLVHTIHPWESAMDAIPTYDPVYRVEIFGDTSHEWHELKLYPNFIKTLLQYKLDLGWNEVKACSLERYN